MSVALIGNFMYQKPDDDAIGSLDILLAYFLLERYVISNFTLYAMCEARRTNSPGIRLYSRLDDICNSPQLRKSYTYICQHLVTFLLVVYFTLLLSLYTDSLNVHCASTMAP